MAEQAPGFGDGERDHAGVGGRGLVREYRAGAWVPVRRRSRAAVTAQMATAAMTSTVCRAIAVYRRTWDWSSPKQSLESVTDYGASTGFRPRPRSRIRGIRWLADVCRWWRPTVTGVPCG